jgi:enoyl-CoA hydratase
MEDHAREESARRSAVVSALRWGANVELERSAEGLAIGVADRVGYVVVDRPDRLNALSRSVLANIAQTVDGYSSNDDVWVVVLGATGDRAFSAGADLKEVNEHDHAQGSFVRPMTGATRNAFEVVLECTKPTIAAINGVAAGAGCELALACDLRIASENASIGLPEAKRGMGALFGSVMLPRLVPRAVAFEMLYFGEFMSAADARGWGLFNQVVPRQALETTVCDVATELQRRAPLTLRRYKAMVTRTGDLPISTALRIDVRPDPYGSADRVEGVSAFLERRDPNWRAD